MNTLSPNTHRADSRWGKMRYKFGRQRFAASGNRLRALLSVLSLALVLANLDGRASAQSASQPAATAARFNGALVASMHHDAAGLPQAVADEFNVTVMAAFIVGPSWTALSNADQAAVAMALRRYLAARFADAFDDFHGERMIIDPNVQSRGTDTLVRTDIIHDDGTHTHLDYRMRAYDGHWRIIDVFLDGVSQLTTQRADLAAVTPNGAAALVARLDVATRALR